MRWAVFSLRKCEVRWQSSSSSMGLAACSYRSQFIHGEFIKTYYWCSGWKYPDTQCSMCMERYMRCRVRQESWYVIKWSTRVRLSWFMSTSSERTKNRPIASGRVSETGAYVLLIVLLAALLSLSMCMNFHAWAIYVPSQIIAVTDTAARRAVLGVLWIFPLNVLYPLMKRWTSWPQAWLGVWRC